MALQKQNLPINLGQGIDTKSDNKHVVPGRSTLLQNAVHQKLNRVQKRTGHVALPFRDIDGNRIDDGDSLAVYKDELLLYRSQKLYSYSPSAQRWVDKGGLVSLILKTDPVVNNTAEQTQVNSAVNDNMAVYAWEDSRGGVRGSVVDVTSGTPMLTDVSIDASGSRVRCASFSNYLYVFYYKSGSLYVSRVNAAAPSEFETPVEISSTVNTTSPTYDVMVYAGIRILYAHNVQGSSEIKFGAINEAGSAAAGFTTATISEAGTDCIAIIQNTSQKITVAYYNTTDKFRAATYSNTGTSLVSPTTVDSTSTTVVNATGYISSSTGITILYELDETNDYDHYVKSNTFSETGTAGTASVFKRSVGLWSKCFSYTDTAGTSQSFVAVVHASNLQPTYFIIRCSDGLISGKMLYSVGGGLTTRPILQTVDAVSVGFTFALLQSYKLVSEGGEILTPTGISRTTVDFTNIDAFTGAQLGQTFHIVGGILSMYDGESVVEHGFHLYPENLSASGSTSGGSLTTGDYTCKFLYEWTDNNGQVHKSAPSLAVTGNVASGSTGSVTYTIPTLRLTAKDGTGRTGVRIVGYYLSGATYYRFTSVSATANNDVTADTVTVTLTTTASLTSNEILYTTGGVLENFAAPACSTIAVFKDRIFLGGLEQANQIVYSKLYTQGNAVAFTDAFSLVIEPQGGRDTAFGVLDDKLLIFKKDRYYYTFGDGPNDLGFDGSFSPLQFVTADIGINNNNSITRMPRGLMLKGDKGIHIVDASLGVAYIGAPVEDFNNLTVTSAVLVSNKNQVRFTTSAGEMLVYDYFSDRWSVFTGLEARRAVDWLGSYVILQSTGAILRSDETVYTDAGKSYSLAIQTGWIFPAGIAGYQRCYKVNVRGEYKSAHKIMMQVGYDLAKSFGATVTFDPESLLEVSTYGSESPYGSGSVYGGTSNAYRFEVGLEKQKCECLRFYLEEQPSTEGTQESLTLSDFVLTVGVKQGPAKVRSALKVGTSS